MERTNNQKAELIAIYRLEFYKKQKSWKLNKDTKLKKFKPKNEKRILNKTYDVEQPTTQSSFLNDAFIDTIPDNDECSTQSSSVPTKIDTTIETECVANKLPDNANKISPNCLPNEQSGKSHPWIHPVFKLQRNYPENAFTEEHLNNKQEMLDFKSYPGELQTGYLFNSNENLMHTSTLDQLLSKDFQMIPGLDCGDNASNVLYSAGNQPEDECLWWPDEVNLHWMNDNAEGSALSELSTDSWLDFLRGADMAPHSSKVELSLPNALSDLEVSSDALARLSSVQLEQAVRTHTLLLRKLLKEETHRRRLRSCLSLTSSTIERPQFSPRPATELCVYEQPTRDFGPYFDYNTSNHPLHRTFKVPEEVFGTYKSDFQPLGRGRGRLQNAKFDTSDRIVGVGRGRHFRLT